LPSIKIIGDVIVEKAKLDFPSNELILTISPVIRLSRPLLIGLRKKPIANVNQEIPAAAGNKRSYHFSQIPLDVFRIPSRSGVFVSRLDEFFDTSNNFLRVPIGLCASNMMCRYSITLSFASFKNRHVLPNAYVIISPSS